MIGALQALEAIKVVLDLGENLAGRLVLFDGLTHDGAPLRCPATRTAGIRHAAIARLKRSTSSRQPRINATAIHHRGHRGHEEFLSFCSFRNIAGCDEPAKHIIRLRKL